MPVHEESSPKPTGYTPQVFSDAGGIGRAHLIGIAGAGLRSLARVLSGWGCEVGGSDLTPGPAEFFAAEGVCVHAGHAASNVPRDADLVVYSDAIPPENPELRRARELGIPVLSYFEMLGRLMADRQGLAVAGTHGKSTTAAMAAELLVGAGLDPTVVFGAAPLDDRSGGRPGLGELMLVEACEYRTNFLHLAPQQAVILGIEPDHFDYYHSGGQLEQAFAQFAKSVPSDGLVLAQADCRVTGRVTAGLQCRVETFGFDATADWSARHLRARRGAYRFKIHRRGEPLGMVSLRIPGRHNVLNALAAAALAWENGLTSEQIARGLSRFAGLKRRLERVGSWRGVVLLDDYAHHPTEVAATLETVRRMYPGRRLWCVFQPHQVSRTKHLLDELAASLQNADKIVVTEIFRAREPAPTHGEVTAADLAYRVSKRGGDVAGLHTTDRICRLLETDLRPGDVLLTMGAGDIRKICHELVDGFRKDRAAG